MTNKEFYRELGNIDPKMIEAAAPAEKVQKKKKNTWVKWGALAACFALIISAAIGVPLLLDSGSFGDPLPPISTITGGSEITGKQEVIYGNPDTEASGNASMIAPGFYINTVVHANVVEVLPDQYYEPGSDTRYHVARLSVVEAIRGNGLPDEIFLRFPFYSADIFDGYDTFIFSLQQIGVENYMMINETKREVTYFSHMFVVEMVSDLGYGSVIAFRDGKVDTSFFDKANHFDVCGYISNILKNPSSFLYPVGHDTTLAEAKTNIIELSLKTENESMFVSHLPCDYITAEDIFISDEGREARDYIKPSDMCVFMQQLYIREDRIIAEYTRVINGFLTDERITINGYTGENGNVLRNGQVYTAEDLAKIPNIGEAIAAMDLSKLTPPHTEIKNGMSLQYSIATGVYRKAGSKIYGIVRVLWYYTYPGIMYGYVRDDCYYLYDQEGNGSIVERNELRRLIGNDPIIASFAYGRYVVFDK